MKSGSLFNRRSMLVTMLAVGLLGCAVQAEEKPIALHSDGQRVLQSPAWQTGMRQPGLGLQPWVVSDGEQLFAQRKTEALTDHSGFGEPAIALHKSMWDGAVEVGVDATHGNSNTLDIFVGMELQRDTTGGRFDFDLEFAKKYAGGTLTAHHTLVDLAHFWIEPDNPLSWFVRGGLEYDEFRIFDVRLKAAGGIQKLFFDGDRLHLSWRIGAGVSQELGGVDDRIVPEADFGLSVIHEISQRRSFETSMDYYPDWSNFTEYRFESKASWEIVMDEQFGWSLKLSLIQRYDSTPDGSRPNDLTYWILLAWQL